MLAMLTRLPLQLAVSLFRSSGERRQPRCRSRIRGGLLESGYSRVTCDLSRRSFHVYLLTQYLTHRLTQWRSVSFVI
jgi:hypothetical protein